MTRLDTQYERFSHLLDKQLDGDAWTAGEQAEFDALLQGRPDLRAEAAVLLELRELDVPPSPASRSLAESALVAFQKQQAQSLQPDDAGALAGRRRRRRAIVVLAGLLASAAAIALAVGLTSNSGPETASPGSREDGSTTVGLTRVELVYASGAVQVRDVDGQEQSSDDARKRLLSVGQTLDVGEGSACFVLDPGIDVCLDRNSRLRISEVDGEQRRFELQRGRVALHLDHQPRGFSVTVVAFGVESTAVGTSFSVAVDTDATVRTTVMEGRVRVAHGSGAESVSAHHRLEVADGAAEQVTLSRTEEAAEWAVVGPTRLWQGRAATVLYVAGEPAAAEVWLDGNRIGAAPLTSLVSAGAHRLSVRGPAGSFLDETLLLEAGHRRDVTYQGPHSGPPQATVLPGATAAAAKAARHEAAPKRKGMRREHYRMPPAGYVPRADELLSEARRLMTSRRFEQAAQTYEALRSSHPESPEARAVLVALAQLELEHRNDARKAKRLAGRYLAGGPGPLTQEARHTEIKALRALGRTEEERVAVSAFLRSYPDSFQRVELERRLTEIAADAESPSQQAP